MQCTKSTAFSILLSSTRKSKQLRRKQQGIRQEDIGKNITIQKEDMDLQK